MSDLPKRVQINEETRSVREMIVAQAFAEVDVIDDRGEAVPRAPASSPQSPPDPGGIRQWRPAS